MAAARRSACPVRTRRCPRRSCRPMPGMTWPAACSAARTTTASTVRRYRADGPVAPTGRASAVRLRAGRRAPNPCAEGAEPIRFYAVQGDLVGLSTGMSVQYRRRPTAAFSTARGGAGPGAGRARHRRPGRRVPAQRSVGCLLLHAGRDIWYADVKVAGPGLLDVVAGRNLVQEDRASIVSVGAARRQAAGRGYRDHGGARPVPTTTRWASATWTRPIAPWPARPWPASPARWSILRARAGDWLRVQDGYTGSDQDVLARFEALPLALRQAFLRSVLRRTAGRRARVQRPGPRPGSYLRGRQHRGAVPGRRGARRRHLDVRTVRRAQRRRRLDPAAGARRPDRGRRAEWRRRAARA